MSRTWDSLLIHFLFRSPQLLFLPCRTNFYYICFCQLLLKWQHFSFLFNFRYLFSFELQQYIFFRSLNQSNGNYFISLINCSNTSVFQQTYVYKVRNVRVCVGVFARWASICEFNICFFFVVYKCALFHWFFHICTAEK